MKIYQIIIVVLLIVSVSVTACNFGGSNVEATTISIEATNKSIDVTKAAEVIQYTREAEAIQYTREAEARDEVVAEVVTATPTNTPLGPTSTATPIPSPVPTNTPTPDPRLFWDDFDNGLKSDWQIDHGKWQMVNKRLTVTEFVDDTALIVIGGSNWLNYSIDLDVGNLDSEPLFGDKNWLSIQIRIQDKRNYMWFAVGKDFAECGIIEDGVDRIINAIKMNVKDAHIHIETQGNKHEFIVHNENICFFEDNTFSGGNIALKAFADDVGAPWVDNIEVTNLP